MTDCKFPIACDPLEIHPETSLFQICLCLLLTYLVQENIALTLLRQL